MNSMFKLMAVGLLLMATLLAVPPASATHYTYCSTTLYDPLTGDPLLERCYTRYDEGNGCYRYRYYYDGPVNVYDQTRYSCNGNSYTCYANEVYVDTNPVLVGLC